jgi:hypothetical protein
MISLLNPAGQATMRASDPAGNVYSVKGLLRVGPPNQTALATPQGPPDSRRSATAPPKSLATSATPASCADGQVRCFNPVLYAIDTVIPLISLDQRSTWYPDAGAPGGTFMQWWLNIATLLGWLLSSIFVLALARIVRNP